MYLYTFVFRVCVLILQCKFNQLGFWIFQGGSSWPTPILQLDPLMHLYISIDKISNIHVQQFLILFSLKIYCQYLTDLCVKMQKYKNMPCLRFWSAKVQYTCVQCLIFSVQICCSYIFWVIWFKYDSELRCLTVSLHYLVSVLQVSEISPAPTT